MQGIILQEIKIGGIKGISNYQIYLYFIKAIQPSQMKYISV